VPPSEPFPGAATLPGLVTRRVLDAPLAALAWLLLERGVPVLVAGRDGALRAALVEGLVGGLPEGRRPGNATAHDPPVVVAGTLADGAPPGILRGALAATTRRSGLVAAVDADDLAGVLAVLHRQGISPDEASFLGVVLVVGAPVEGSGPRVVVAHYLRPLARDAGGHPRRLAPAVLAAWDEATGRWEDFAWGIGPDLAERCRMPSPDFEAELSRRAAALAAAAG
jgi:hypothetical protein